MRIKPVSQTHLVEKENGKVEGILAAVYQSVFGGDVYPSLEEDVYKRQMQEVSAGATDTAEHVQNQLEQTHAIQDKVDEVADVYKRQGIGRAV